MANQAPSTNLSKTIDLGNAIVYYAKTPKTSFSSAGSATDWRKLGMLKNGVQLDISKAVVDVKSGVPQRLVARFFTEETLKVAGELMEITPFNLSRALGELGITATVKATGPSPTTVAAGSTKSSVVCAAVTGFKVDDLICVGTPGSGSEQFAVIKGIDVPTKTFTFYEPLDGDVDPTTGAAVSKVDKMSLPLGTVAAPKNIALKIVKTSVSGWMNYTLYIPTAVAEGNLSLAFNDNGNVDTIGIPFSFEAMSDAQVENGALAQAEFSIL